MVDGLTEQVVSALAKVKHIPRETITPDGTLESLKLDSLDTITLLFELEEGLGVTIPDDRVRTLRTVGDVIDIVRQLKDPAIAGT
jgi:acyl carrier protein